jgi:hypothetical protein
LVAGIAGNRVWDCHAGLAALPGARKWHGQRRRARLTDLRIRPLRGQQHVRIESQVGERSIDERLQKLSRKEIRYVRLEERT